MSGCLLAERRRMNFLEELRQQKIYNDTCRAFDIANKNLEWYQELVDIFAKALSILTPTQRICMEAKYIEGLTNKEIAQSRYVSYESVRTAIKKATKIILASIDTKEIQEHMIQE